MVGLFDAGGRVLADDVVAGEPVPAFDRAAMDGYAVRGEETFGATPTPRPSSARRRGAAGHADATSRSGRARRSRSPPARPSRRGRRGRQGRVDRDRRPTVSVVEPTPAGPPRRPSRRGHRGRDRRPSRGTGAPAAGPRRPERRGSGRSLSIRRPPVHGDRHRRRVARPGTPARGCRIADMNSVMLAALIARDGGVCRVGRAARRRPRRVCAAVAAAAGSRRRAGLRGELDRPGGPRAGARGRAGRTVGARRRAAAGEPDRPGVRRATSRSSSCRATR